MKVSEKTLNILCVFELIFMIGGIIALIISRDMICIIPIAIGFGIDQLMFGPKRRLEGD